MGWPNAYPASNQPANAPMPYADQIRNAAATTAKGLANFVDGVVELGVKGTYNALIARPASGVAALPALLMGGPEAYTAIQADIQRSMSAEIVNPGGKAIEHTLGQLLEPVGQGISQLRSYSESKIGDGSSAILFGTAQAAVEIGGFYGGLGGLRAGASAAGLDAASLSAAREVAGARLGQMASTVTSAAEELGTSMVNGIRTGASAVADAMPAGSAGRVGMQGLRYELGAVGDVGNARLGTLGRVETVLADARAAEAAVVQIETRSAAAANEAMVKAGNQPAWLADTTVQTQVVPKGAQYNMVVSEAQAQALARGEQWFGNWATPDGVPNQAFARNNLSILPEFKPDVSHLVRIETTAAQRLNNGIAGPLGGYTGTAAQVEFLGAKNLRMVGEPQRLPVGNVGANGGGIPGVLTDANFAQKASSLNKTFSDEGIAKYTELAGRPVNTVSDLKAALMDRTIHPSQVPIDFVDLNGTRLILNTRTSTALDQAGVPRIDWHGIDKTNIPAYDGVTFNDLAAQQLKRNGYPSTGRPSK